ncbi:Hypothetical predicted protein [Paramuricea clavata]|uniref:Uncharacterized protein n=1 Tax=Paramuricea clavata TaxID=317549 RepID=A0A7D9LBZ5_PARCT|nr:Hypothetical predicted protein [Paramuricea clavata]
MYPVPKKIKEIEIVVPDTTNKDRDSQNEKFYKYVVYNHTSCTCGNLKYRDSKLYKTITNNEVSEAYFKAKFSKNPVNLMRVCNVCNSTQPRYQLHPDHFNANPQSKYLAYRQRLPGCVVVQNNTSYEETSKTFNKVDNVLLTNDILCEAYDGAKTQQQGKNDPQKLKSDQRDQEANYEILVYIASGKIILAAFLLSLVLFTILIMDFTLCHRKKGFLYALVACKTDDADHFCQGCSERTEK